MRALLPMRTTKLRHEGTTKSRNLRGVMPKSAKAVSWLTNRGRTTIAGRGFTMRLFELLQSVTMFSGWAGTKIRGLVGLWIQKRQKNLVRG